MSDPTSAAVPDAGPTGQPHVSAVIVLAAGGGTRMKSRTSKLLHTIAGRSLVGHAITAAEELAPQHLVVVVGHQRDQVQAHLGEVAPQVTIAVQEQQRGTGDAVRAGLASVGELTGEIVVTYGDVPLLQGSTLRDLVAAHRHQGNAITVLTSRVADPTGYGRIVRDESGAVRALVEHRDADEQVRAIDEINSGVYVFDAAVLADGLGRISDDNAQHECYLTDVPGIAVGDGRRVGAWLIEDRWQTEGVNDRTQLAAIGAELNRRIARQWQLAGVTITDPATTWIDADVTLSPDVTLLPGTMLHGATAVSPGATIGPDTTLIDCEVGEDAEVTRAHAQLAVIGPRASVGPYAYLRPGTELGVGSRLGAFVEGKNTRLGEGAKAQHLSYLGDTVIGPYANIGAGTIFANYDGVAKHTSTVGEASFVGSNSVIVAPVAIADGTYVAAGSAITEDLAPGELGIARGRQRNIDGWVASRRAGTKTAAAAQRAAASNHTPPTEQAPTDGPGTSAAEGSSSR